MEEVERNFSKFQPIQFIQKLEQIAVEKDHIQRILQLLGKQFVMMNHKVLHITTHIFKFKSWSSFSSEILMILDMTSLMNEL